MFPQRPSSTLLPSRQICLPLAKSLPGWSGCPQLGFLIYYPESLKRGCTTSTCSPVSVICLSGAKYGCGGCPCAWRVVRIWLKVPSETLDNQILQSVTLPLRYAAKFALAELAAKQPLICVAIQPVLMLNNNSSTSKHYYFRETVHSLWLPAVALIAQRSLRFPIETCIKMVHQMFC